MQSLFVLIALSVPSAQGLSLSQSHATAQEKMLADDPAWGTPDVGAAGITPAKLPEPWLEIPIPVSDGTYPCAFDETTKFPTQWCQKDAKDTEWKTSGDYLCGCPIGYTQYSLTSGADTVYDQCQGTANKKKWQKKARDIVKEAIASGTNGCDVLDDVVAVAAKKKLPVSVCSYFGIATVPAAGAMPAMPDMGAMPAMPAAGAMPGMPDMGAMPAMPDMGAMPAMPAMPDVGAMPAVPAAGEMPPVPEMGAVPEVHHATMAEKQDLAKK